MKRFKEVNLKKALILAIAFLILSFPLLFANSIENSSAALSYGLYLKWSASPKNTGSLIGPLAAKLVANSIGLQIVVTGGSSANDVDQLSSHGSITCLNGTNGAIIWQKDQYSTSIHQPFQLADLYNDGRYKVVVSNWNETVVLNGNDGTENWTSIAPSGNVLPAVADVNGDGFLEVFVSSGNGPYRGSDWITTLSHDGAILNQAYTWHPCYGGLTIGDPNSNGNFMLFSSDRSYTYAPENDTYKGGGLGIRAFDAETLTPLWDYPIGFASSHVPILADVDKDGKLDVIVGNEGNNGIDVLNASDGTISGNRTGSTDMPAHLQPTVADLDRDGNLEFIACNSSQPKIWDLYKWTSEGALTDEVGQPLYTEEPPKVGNVTGGNYPDIIASAMSGLPNPYKNQYNKVYVYEFSLVTRKYEIVAVLSNLSESPNNFSLVADVDGDGKNELVLTGGGTIYVYGTQVPVAGKPVRSNLQFYSECNRGEAVYVPPPIPVSPVLKQEYPQHDSLNQDLNPTLSVKVVDYGRKLLAITFSTNASGFWQNVGSFNNVQSGVYTVTGLNMSIPGTTYYWRVIASNYESITFGNYKFTTYSPAPTQGVPSISKNAGQSGEDLEVNNMSTSGTGSTTNIYSWVRNDKPFASLQLPFDTRTSDNPLELTSLVFDGFEKDLVNWNPDASNWNVTRDVAHSGSYSVHAGPNSYYLISKPIDLSNAESVTISFWYRTHGSPEAYFMLWNGKWYDYLINLGSNNKDDVWCFYSVQTYAPQYLNSHFMLGFDAVGFDSTTLNQQQSIWIDDFQISTQTKTKDYSGNNIDATVHGATWTNQGISGGAYRFDGINDWISIPDDEVFGNGSLSELTAQFWINPSKSQKGAVLLGKKTAPMKTGSYMVGFEESSTANHLYWGITSNSDNQWHKITSANSIAVNKWSLITCTYKSGQGLTIYINGIQQASLPLSGSIALGPDPFSPDRTLFGQPLFIGSDGSSKSNTWFAGLIDDVRIYPIALPPSQILQQYTESIQGSTNSSTISSTQTNINEVWKCKVTPNDSFSDGTPQFTNSVKIGSSLVTWNLTVISDHGVPTPHVGRTAFTDGSIVTAKVENRKVIEDNTVWVCTGWKGTGSVQLFGSGIATTFILTEDSSIIWNWELEPTSFNTTFATTGLPTGVPVTYTVNGGNHLAATPQTYSEQLLANDSLSFSISPMIYISNNKNYTLDHWQNSAEEPISSPIIATQTDTLTAVYISRNISDSNSSSSNLPKTRVATPIFSPIAGNYSTTQYISIICDTIGSKICYTTNGAEPTASSTIYSEPIYLNNGTITLKAKAFADEMEESETSFVTYTIKETYFKMTVISDHGNPTPANGTYSSTKSLVLSISSPLSEAGEIWICTGWTGTGSVPVSGSETSITLTITENSTITWNWVSIDTTTTPTTIEQPLSNLYYVAVAPLAILAVAILFFKLKEK